MSDWLEQQVAEAMLGPCAHYGGTGPFLGNTVDQCPHCRTKGIAAAMRAVLHERDQQWLYTLKKSIGKPTYDNAYSAGLAALKGGDDA